MKHTKKRAMRYIATKRGAKHPIENNAHYTGKKAVLPNGENSRVIAYKHGRNYGMKLMSNHDRVTAGRIAKEL